MEEETKPNEYPCTLGGCVEPAPNGMTEEEWRLKNIEYAESLTYLSSAGLSQYKDLIDIMYEERTGKKLERENKTHEIEPVVEDIRVNEDRIVEKLITRMKKDFVKIERASEPTPDYIKDMYKLPSEDSNPFKSSGYKYGGTMESESLKQERERRESEAREARIKSELELLDKSDWYYFKEFVVREWNAAKELWKRWRGR